MGSSICIVSMNRGELFRYTLQEVFKNSIEPYEVIIVDNGSTDATTLEVLKWAEQSGATVVYNEDNKGLSVATNQGFELGKYDCLIHMDDDCLVHYSGWNTIMENYLRIPEVGMVAPQQSPISINHGSYQELSWALGLCWGIRKSLFDDIGGYDPQLYHQNECDMALRVRMAGYRLAGIADFSPIHNDPAGPRAERSEYSKTREVIGCIQFRDKWCSYFRNRNWKFGTDPIYLMQHWPPDQEFLQRYAVQEGLMLNPIPEGMATMPEHLDAEGWKKLDALAGQQKVTLRGIEFLIYRELRQDYCHWEWLSNPGAHDLSAQVSIERWFELTGERYEGYKWSHNLLRPY